MKEEGGRREGGGRWEWDIKLGASQLVSVQHDTTKSF